MSKQQLKVKAANGVLSITIGTATLRHACEIGRQYGTGQVKITSEKIFIDGLARELKSEDEHGSNLVHTMFDAAVNSMLENGELGIDYLKDD
jgi:hypothetical protein